MQRVSRLVSCPERTRGYATGLVLAKAESVNCGHTVILRPDCFELFQMALTTP